MSCAESAVHVLRFELITRRLIQGVLLLVDGAPESTAYAPTDQVIRSCMQLHARPLCETEFTRPSYHRFQVQHLESYLVQHLSLIDEQRTQLYD
jgi:hypothetical protein